MTLHWDAETCLWLFQRSSLRDLNLGCWARIPWTKTYRLFESQLWIKWLVWAGSSSCWKIYGPSDATVSIHGFTTSISTTIALGQSKLSPFNDCGDILSNDSSSLAPSLDCSKTVYFATNIINVDLGYPKNRIIFVAERPTRRSSMIAALRLYST